MTYQEAFLYGKNELNKGNIPDGDLDAWYLLEYVTGMSRADFFLHGHEEISEEIRSRYKECIEKRLERIPLQHITGTQDFMGLTFMVNEHVLVPRQDTEVLVEVAEQYLKPGDKLLDMCTGSGCILISLLKRADADKANQAICGVGADISPEALKVARENGRNLGAEAFFILSDLFENVEGTFDMIVSNPPYIPTAVIEGLSEEVKGHDPFIALDGKEDGLHFYRRIVAESRDYLKKGGRLIFEIGHDQGEAVKGLMENAGFSEVIVKKDLAGLDRVVSGVYNIESM